ncbi:MULTISPECIES: HAD family hydrolase [unclassified Nonomuraea]|uniref:HAD family hydrolase n=1 Tax=Nonomuraea sp. NPDC003804 TaxID=3154547 RepID=UPI0033B41BB3
MVKGVLIDWGGVLTTSMSEAVAGWIAADRLDGDHYRAVMRELLLQESVVHALERGEISAADFERDLAARLRTIDGTSPVAEGLLSRMFLGFQRVDAMYDMLLRVRGAGIKTCLLSNSWANEYPRDGWDEVFDAVVISGEIGMRKPEPRIFEHALDLIGLRGPECVFIDDFEINIVAARELGIGVIHHTTPDTTIAELETLLRLPLR